MSPPVYSDLGKSARDVFSRGYHFGVVKLDIKTKTQTGVEFSSGGAHNQDTGKVSGNLESKYKIKEYGLTFVEKWNTDNTIGCDITLADKLVQGLQLGYSSTFAPQTGARSGKLKTVYKHENVAVTSDFDLSLKAGPLINSSLVLGYQGWLAGYQAAFDTQSNKLTKNNFAVGFNASDFHLHGSVENGREFGGSIYHKVKPELEGAVNISFNSSNNTTQFGLGTKYNLEKDVSVRAKINSHLQIGLGYEQKLHDGVTFILSANIDGKNFGSGGHKLGFALNLEA